VRSQDYRGSIEHVVVVDDDDKTFTVLERFNSTNYRRVVPILVRRPPAEAETSPESDDRTVYPRLARLLNIGVRRATSPWISFLDDDNEYEPNHLRALRDFARSCGSPAVHSARQMVWADGTPYLEPLFPGPGSAIERARIYSLMCERGVCEPGTNVVRDRVDPVQSTFRNSTMMRAADPVFLVDQNLWLIRRGVLLGTPIPEEFTEQELDDHTCPDDKMLEALYKRGIPIASNGAPTVKYYLGGVSNRADCDRL
jgi:glycosyltransferase involved in cell wall biosynthesis